MAILKIALMGNPILRQVAEPVADPTDPAIEKLADDMRATLERFRE
jgi:peptide deformylase